VVPCESESPGGSDNFGPNMALYFLLKLLLQHIIIIIIIIIFKKQSLLQAWTDRDGSRRLRLSDFKTVGT